jgi:ectoine hydroxylase
MWTADQLRQYDEQGFLRVPGLFSAKEVAALKAVSDDYVERYRGEGTPTGDDERRVHWVKEHAGPVRSIFALHRQVEPYRQAIRKPQVAGPLKQILGGDAYVFHSKVNVKDAFEGAVWLWHQDYGYWQYDGVDDRMTSVMIMLDKTTIHSGCLLFVPGSHRWGVLEHYSDEKTTSYKQWCVKTDVLKQHVTDPDALVAAVGEPGDAYFFDCKALHGSGHNLAPSSRQTLIYACAHIDNRAKGVEKPRPDWVVDREYENVTEHVAVGDTVRA